MKRILSNSLFFFVIFFSCKKEVIPPPPVIADFDYLETKDGSVNFYNKSQNATSYEWDFNTGNNSTLSSPVYKFANNKDYLVTLTAKGLSGQNSKSKTIRITTKPTTGNYAFYTSWANSGYIDIYVSGSYEGRLAKYYTSGSPDCFDSGTITITKPAGIYSYTAKSTAGYTWSGNIEIINGLCLKTVFTQ
jgi:PKD repeat protein